MLDSTILKLFFQGHIPELHAVLFLPLVSLAVPEPAKKMKKEKENRKILHITNNVTIIKNT